MKNIYKLLFILFILSSSFTFAQSILLQEYFNYPVGTLVSTLTNFNLRSAGSTFKQTISSKVLTYSGYGGSGVGKSDSLTYDGDDYSRDFAVYAGSGQPIPASAVTTGSVYFSALVNVQTTGAVGDYFLSFHWNNTFNGKIFVQNNGTGFSFGTGKNTAVYETTVRNYNTTYLVVVKYTFNSGTNDDAIDMWVNPGSLTTEPASVAPFNNVTDAVRGDYAAIGGVAIRQGGTAPAIPPKVYVAGIRVATNWGVLLTSAPTAVEDRNNSLPTNFSVEQNYPNPFNPSTMITYTIPESGVVNISLFNSLGQKVATLFTGESAAGKHQINWNGKNQFGNDVSSGVYFARITFGNQSKSIKMMLAR
jgi:hypothetical protein